MIIDTLKNKLAENEARMQTLNDVANERVWDESELAEVEKLAEESAGIRRQLAARDSIVAAKAENSAPVRKTTPVAARSITSNEKAFKSFGDFAQGVRAAAYGRAPDRVMNALSVYGSEGTAADGGYAVPTEYSKNINQYIYGVNSLVPQCSVITTTQNSIVVPVDDRMPWGPFSGTGGWAHYDEAAAISQAKPQLSTLTITARKLGLLVPVTDELMQDAVALGAYLEAKSGDALTYDINARILSGAATDGPKGFLVSSGLKTVATASTNTGTTVVAEDVANMYFAMPAQDRQQAVWIINPSVEAKLYGAVVSGTNVAAYIPGGTIANQPYSTLMGRPVFVDPSAPALGAKGCINFVNLKKYWLLSKGGVEAAVSPHLWFDQHVTAFRWTVRLGGDTRNQAVITLPDSTTQSPFVTLAASA